MNDPFLSMLAVLAVKYGTNAFTFEDAVEIKIAVFGARAYDEYSGLIGDISLAGLITPVSNDEEYYRISQKGWENLDGNNDV